MAPRPFGGQSDRGFVLSDVIDALENAFKTLDRIGSVNRDEAGFVHPFASHEEAFDLLFAQTDDPFLPVGEIAEVIKA